MQERVGKIEWFVSESRCWLPLVVALKSTDVMMRGDLVSTSADVMYFFC